MKKSFQLAVLFRFLAESNGIIFNSVEGLNSK